MSGRVSGENGEGRTSEMAGSRTGHRGDEQLALYSKLSEDA
jgi:hypothetical protein